MLDCYFAYWRKNPISAQGPYMLSLDLSNECNANCLFCRDARGVIPDVNPKGRTGTIPKGKMPLEMALDIIRQLKDYLLIAVLYTNGEPLIYKDLARVIQSATDQGVATMIATNGSLLTERKIEELLDAGLDFVKIAISGFSKDIYNVQVRHGDIEKIKSNIRLLVEKNKKGRFGTVIMIDYILYNYNQHELKLVQDFCRPLGIMLNVRPGNPKGGLEDQEPALSQAVLPLKGSCDWIWKAMQLDWNGDILACCECAVWSDTTRYGTFKIGVTNLLEIWNGHSAQKMRMLLNEKGRGAVSVCSRCERTSITFKW